MFQGDYSLWTLGKLHLASHPFFWLKNKETTVIVKDFKYLKKSILNLSCGFECLKNFHISPFQSTCWC